MMNDGISAVLKAILATLLYIIGMEAIGVWSLLADTIGATSYEKYYLFIQGALQLVGVLIFTFFAKNRTLKNWIPKTDRKWYILAFLLGISFVFIQTPLNFIYNSIAEKDFHIAYRFDGLPKFKDINLISTILFAPIGEELFFREYIQSRLQHKLNTLMAILLAAVLFASIHAPYMNLLIETWKQTWHLFYLTIFGGLISGILYYKSKSIGPSFIFHIFLNTMVTIV